MYSRHRVYAVVAGALVVAACAERAPLAPPGPGPSLALAEDQGVESYVLDFVGYSLPPTLAAQVQAAGGTLTATIDRIGVAVAASSDAAFPTRAAAITGVSGVAPDIVMQWVDPVPAAFEAEAAVGAFETFRLTQWAPDAIHAPAAWDAGARGAGTRVAIVDGGIRDTHIDIAPNLDVARSRSFVTGPPFGTQPFNFDIDRDARGRCVQQGFWHGTHVAGIVAAPANNVGTVGIAPQATIIGVKVLHCGIGMTSWIVNGIVYAATPIAQGGAGADIINLSLGATFERQAFDTAGRPLHTARAAAVLARAVGKATTYAYQQGATVIAALGNNALDLDTLNDLIVLPAMSPHVIAVSATGPKGFGRDSTNFDRPASYTNFGKSAVDLAGPGGDFAYPVASTCTKPILPAGLIPFPCFVFDFVVAPCRGDVTSNSTYCWAIGTSQATPAVSGVAALIVGRFGRIGPAAVGARLRRSADDLGKRGNDDFYGLGRVNAQRAVQ